MNVICLTSHSRLLPYTDEMARMSTTVFTKSSPRGYFLPTVYYLSTTVVEFSSPVYRYYRDFVLYLVRYIKKYFVFMLVCRFVFHNQTVQDPRVSLEVLRQHGNLVSFIRHNPLRSVKHHALSILKCYCVKYLQAE